jgi:NADPH2:quinone reductase
MSWRIQFSQHGPAEVLQWQEQPDTPLAADAVRVRLQAIGVNFIDCYYRSGLYPVASLPSGLGSEGAGVIEAVGSAVQGWQVGERVAYATAPLGAYAEYQDVPPGCLLRLPEQISCEQAAAGLLKGLTVQYLLRQTYPVQAGQHLLWHAAAGGVGLLACQWARSAWSARRPRRR